MSGSGTTAVIARTLGHKAIGFDTDPLAVLLGRTWCANVDERATLRTAARVSDAANRLAAHMRIGKAYPFGADDETRKFVRYWFDRTNRRQLAALAQSIRAVRSRRVRDLLWCAFSRLIITKQAGASLALDVAHSRPHKVADKTVIRPNAQFEHAVRRILAVAPFKQNTNIPSATIKMADARRLPIRASSIHIAICSPPYVNAIDYLRGHKFSLVWMGHNVDALRRVRSTNIGTEVSKGARLDDSVISHALAHMGDLGGLPDRQKRLLGRYVEDMDKALGELHRVLIRGGRAVLVVGDCMMRGVFIRNSDAIVYLAKRHGFRLARRRRRHLPPNRRYLPPPSSRRSGRMLQNRLRTEVLLDFVKP
jgi:hypothetical protein